MSYLEFKKVKTKKIYEEVCEILHEKIRTGELRPGDKLDSVEQLATGLQVSRSAVREALSALKAMGLIDIRQGSGTYITDVSPIPEFPLSTMMLSQKETVSHLLELRQIIEVGIVELAAHNRTAADIQKMEQILDEMKKLNANSELGEKIDFDFHKAIAQAANNPLLVQLFNQISASMIETIRETRRIWLFSRRTTLEILYDEHMQIFLAIKQQKPDLARLAMQSHLKNVENIVMHYFQSTGKLS